MLQLTEEQHARLGDIGRNEKTPAAVRSLAWLVTRYGEGMPTQDVARLVGITPSATRYWLTVFERNGMALFDRYTRAGMPRAHDAPSVVPISPIPLTTADIHEKTGFSEERARFIESNVHRLFDELAYGHRLGDAHHALLETAAQYYDIGQEGVHRDTDGYFFTALDPVLQRLPMVEQRELGFILKFAGSDIVRPKPKEAGIPSEKRKGCLRALALFRLALALDASDTRATRVVRIEHALPAFYAVLTGPRSVSDATAVEQASELWTRITGQRGRAFVPGSIHVIGGVVEPGLHSARKRSVGVQADDLMENAARKIMRFSLVRILERVDTVYLAEDPEALHKMRTSTRRLRSAFQVFGDTLPVKPSRRFQKHLRRLGRATGLIRDIDVLLMHIDEYNPSGSRPRADLTDFILFLREIRLDELARLRELLRSEPFSRFVHGYYRFVHRQVDETASVMESPPRVREVAPAQIYQRVGAIRAMGRDLQQASIPQLHELRIRFKRMRYTLEFYGEVLGESAGELVADLKNVQDHLGALQDAKRACELIDEYLAVDEYLALVPRRPSGAACDAGEASGGDAGRANLLTYRSARADEIPMLVDRFHDVWREFEGSAFRTKLATAVAAL